MSRSFYLARRPLLFPLSKALGSVCMVLSTTTRPPLCERGPPKPSVTFTSFARSTFPPCVKFRLVLAHPSRFTHDTFMRFLHMTHCYVAFEIQGLEEAGGAMILFGVEEDWTG